MKIIAVVSCSVGKECDKIKCRDRELTFWTPKSDTYTTDQSVLKNNKITKICAFDLEGAIDLTLLLNRKDLYQMKEEFMAELNKIRNRGCKIREWRQEAKLLFQFYDKIRNTLGQPKRPRDFNFKRSAVLRHLTTFNDRIVRNPLGLTREALLMNVDPIDNVTAEYALNILLETRILAF